MKRCYIAVLCCAILGACNVLETDTEALMKPPVFTEEQEKKELNEKIDQLGSDESIKDIAADELDMYPEGTIIVNTEEKK